MDSRTVLEEEIQQLEAQLQARKDALRLLVRQVETSKEMTPERRFYMVRPLDAIRQVLTEQGPEMERQKLMDTLLEGGIAIGRKRKHHNVNISIELNLRLGNLAQRGTKIRLPK